MKSTTKAPSDLPAADEARLDGAGALDAAPVAQADPLDGETTRERIHAMPEPTDDSRPIREWERTVYNMLFRSLGSRKTAKRLVRQMISAGLDPAKSATQQARDLARQELPPDEFARSMFGRGRELLSGGPDTEDLPRLGAGFDPASMEKDIKDALPREHLCILELVFVDRRPLAEVGDLLGVSPEFLVTFIAHLIDLIGELSTMSHESPSPCPHPLRLIRSRIEHGLGYTQREPATNHFCSSCRDATQFTTSLLELFSRDSRILSLGDDRILRKALEGPRVIINDGANRAFPIRNDRPDKRDKEAPPITREDLPGPNAAAWKATAMVGCAIIFMASFSMFSIIGGSGAETDKAGFSKGLSTVKQDKLGTYNNGSGPAKELIANSTLTAGSDKPMTISYHSGIQIELSPQSSITVLQNRIKLIHGRARLRTTEGPTPGFFIANGDLVARVKEGDVWCNADDKSALRFSLRTGVLDVKDARGRRYRLEPSNVMKLASTGQGFVVEESTTEDLAQAGVDTGAPNSGEPASKADDKPSAQ